MKKLLLAILTLAAVGVVSGSSKETTKSSTVRDINVFNAVVKELQANYVDTLNTNTLITTAIDAMLNSVDPYTEYYPYEDREDLTVLSTGKYSGVGAVIQQRPGGTLVSNPTYGSPSRKAGLRHGDLIIEIDGKDITKLADNEKVSRMLRGQAGTTVRVKVKRPYTPAGTDSILTFDIVRGTITNDPVPYYGVDSTGMGYVRLTTYNEQSASKVRDALLDMKRNPALRGVVLDLRGNGGGIIEGAVQIVGLFVPKGTEVVRHSGLNGKNLKIYKTTHQPIMPDMPLVVMIDESSASASEITAGALQDLDRAVIVGTRSYGKGLVQTARPLPNDGYMKVTMARYYIPSGRLIQAIDYSHRNPDGSPMRVPDSLTKVWKTAHGRPVRDGGGITPDVAVSDTSMNRLIYNVMADNWAFNFANRFRATYDSLPGGAYWQMPDTVFESFKAFIDPAKFKYDKACEQGIDYLRRAAVSEGYMNDSVKAQLDILAGMLRHDLGHDLDFNRDKLISILDSEISERYFDDGQLLRRSLRYDLELDTARAVLLDSGRYKKILKNV